MEAEIVEVIYGGRKYTYSKVGELMTWMDDKRMVIPVMLHRILREQALESGADVSIFLSKQREQEVKDAPKSKGSNKKIKGVFNPFS